MSTAIVFARMRGGAETLVAEAGADGLAICQPTIEASLGDQPPIAPVLCRSVQPMANGLRERRTGTNALVTSPLRGKVRGTWEVAWSPMTTGERNAMVAWLAQGVRGTQLGWRLRPDGDGGEWVTVRFVTVPVSTWIEKHVHEAPGTAMVEELYTEGVGAVVGRPV
jgi:hypothetical protein